MAYDIGRRAKGVLRTAWRGKGRRTARGIKDVGRAEQGSREE